jgi:hypothetical protein
MPRYIVEIIKGPKVLAVETIDVMNLDAVAEAAASVMARLVLNDGAPDYRGAVLHAVSEDGRRTFCLPFPSLPKDGPRSRAITTVMVWAGRLEAPLRL